MPSKKLSDLLPGDEVLLRKRFTIGEKEHTQRVLVKRKNRVTLTTVDGRRWNLGDGYEYGVPQYGYMPRVEPYDPEVHPYEQAANKAVRLLQELLQSRVWHKNTKTMAEALPELQTLAKKLGLATPEENP